MILTEFENKIATKAELWNLVEMLFGYRKIKVFNNKPLNVNKGEIVIHAVNNHEFSIYNVRNSGQIDNVQNAISSNMIKQWVSDDTQCVDETILNSKLDVSVYNADKQTFATIDNTNTLLSSKADNSVINNLATKATVNKTIKEGRYDHGRKNIILTAVDGSEKTIDVSALSLPPLFSSMKFDNDTDELVFNDGRSDTRISLSKFLDYVETPEATSNTSGKVTLSTIDSRVDSKINTFKTSELNTMLDEKVSTTIYQRDKATFITDSTLDQKLVAKAYLTANDITGKLDTATYNNDKATFAKVNQLVQSATADTQGKVSLNEIDARIDSKISTIKSTSGIDAMINRIARRP